MASSYTLWISSQDFAKWNTLLRYISVVSFIIIAYVVVKLIFCIDSASMKWPLFRFFWLLFPQKLFDLAEILTRVSPIMQTHCLKNPSKFWKLAQMERTKSLRFWSIFGAQFTVGKSKILLKTKISAKMTSLGISNSDSPSSQKDYRVLIKLIKKRAHFRGFWGIPPLKNIRLCWNFHHGESS